MAPVVSAERPARACRPMLECPQRSLLAVCLRNLRAANRRPTVSFLPEQCDNIVDLLESHAIHGFLRGTPRHRPGIPVNLAVRSEKELGVEQLPVNSLQRESFGSSVLMNFKNGVGPAHPTHLHVPSIPTHLPPFAMWAAFPSSDYYGGSVTIGLSTRRRSRVPCVLDV